MDAYFESSEYKSKLRIGNILIPDPYSICQERWENNPIMWPDIHEGDIFMYLIEKSSEYTMQSLKAYRSLEAYQYFIAGHVSEIVSTKFESHIILRAKIRGSQRINVQHDAWVCAHESGAIQNGHCTCMAG